MNPLIGIRIIRRNQTGLLRCLPRIKLYFADYIGVMILVLVHRPSTAPARNLDDSKRKISKRLPPLFDDQWKRRVERFP